MPPKRCRSVKIERAPGNKHVTHRCDLDWGHHGPHEHRVMHYWYEDKVEAKLKTLKNKMQEVTQRAVNE